MTFGRQIAFATVAALLASVAAAGEPDRAVVADGVYRPIFPSDPSEEEIPVEAFEIDRRQVTNAEFLAFVQEHPKWQRGRAAALYVDDAYLSHWQSPTALGPDVGPDQPVTRVSWFAARAYCEAQGARLPNEAEWERVAAASATDPDASRDPEFARQILAWYAKPGSATLADAGSGPPNYYGVHDLHGLVWEWIEDFNSALVSFDSRDDGGVDGTRFCGAGAAEAVEKEDYAAFMRIAFRSALEARYTTANLGFRCAVDHEEDPS